MGKVRLLKHWAALGNIRARVNYCFANRQNGDDGIIIYQKGHGEEFGSIFSSLKCLGVYENESIPAVDYFTAASYTVPKHSPLWQEANIRALDRSTPRR